MFYLPIFKMFDVILVIDSDNIQSISKETQMGHQNHHYPLFLLFFLFSQNSHSHSWSWFSSSKEILTENPSENGAIFNDVVGDFSMESLNNRKGIQLVENARKKMVASNSCWQNAYQNLFAGCSEILAGEEKRSRLAWHLSDCFQKDSGRPPFPHCDTKSSMLKCLTKLDEDARKIYLETDAFKRQTERLVNELKNSAQFAEDKLETIEEKAEGLLQNSHLIHDSLASIDVQTQQVAKLTQNVEDQVSLVLRDTEAVYEQSKEIAASQSELQEKQATMKDKLEESMAKLHKSSNKVGEEISNLKNQAIEIEEEISKVGNAMSSKMNTLQQRADDIGNMAGISLEKQKQVLDGQSLAFEGLQSLTKFQLQALEENRGTLQEFAELGNRQQEELLRRQELLQQAHDHLVESSKTILAAQEAFESKQASMFVALDKLFALHNAMLLESRFIKALFIYSISILFLYMFTSTKQTYAVRPRLYIGLCVTFLIEFATIRYAPDEIEQQAWIISVVRSLAVVLASIQLLHAICTYRDYELLNYQMLIKLNENLTEQFYGKQRNKEELWDVDMDSEMNWSSWVDTELPEDLDNLEDPDYILPEEVGENSVATTITTKKYNLRSQQYHL
ncbi:unnamed protein product [Camellia sinensis]